MCSPEVRKVPAFGMQMLTLVIFYGKAVKKLGEKDNFNVFETSQPFAFGIAQAFNGMSCRMPHAVLSDIGYSLIKLITFHAIDT